MIEYTGQCVDGPDMGNLITSTVEHVPFEVTYSYRLDGEEKPAHSITVRGFYDWDKSRGYFRWRLIDSTHQLSVER